MTNTDIAVNTDADAAQVEAWPTTREPCPVCDNPELMFKAVQLRSADEGTTIFYRCGKCGHRYVAKSPNLRFTGLASCVIASIFESGLPTDLFLCACSRSI